MSNKSHVGLDTCAYCGEAKGVLLDTRLKASLDSKTVTSLQPCDDCIDRLVLENRCIVVEADSQGKPSGNVCEISAEYLTNIKYSPLFLCLTSDYNTIVEMIKDSEEDSEEETEEETEEVEEIK